MRLLFDNNVPIFLLRVFERYEVSTAFTEGWAQLVNGQLLDEAERNGFDVLITLDKGFQHEQNISTRRIAVAILEPGSQLRVDLSVVAERLAQQLGSLKPGQIVIVGKFG